MSRHLLFRGGTLEEVVGQRRGMLGKPLVAHVLKRRLAGNQDPASRQFKGHQQASRRSAIFT